MQWGVLTDSQKSLVLNFTDFLQIQTGREDGLQLLTERIGNPESIPGYVVLTSYLVRKVMILFPGLYTIIVYTHCFSSEEKIDK